MEAGPKTGETLATMLLRERDEARAERDRLAKELDEANRDWKRMNTQRKRANRQAMHWRKRAQAAERQLGEETPTNTPAERCNRERNLLASGVAWGRKWSVRKDQA